MQLLWNIIMKLRSPAKIYANYYYSLGDITILMGEKIIICIVIWRIEKQDKIIKKPESTAWDKMMREKKQQFCLWN